jgi:hypothetical protein
VITVQARHIIERCPRLVENGFERRKDVLRLTTKVGRKPSLGVDPDDAGDEDLVADPDCGRVLVSFGSRLKRGRYDGRERFWHWGSPSLLRRSFASMEMLILLTAICATDHLTLRPIQFGATCDAAFACLFTSWHMQVTDHGSAHKRSANLSADIVYGSEWETCSN